MNIDFSSDAEQDLVDGYWFYELQEKGAGSHFRSSLLSDAERLRTTGGRHPPFAMYHRALSQILPFALYYRMDSFDSLTVIAILDQRQKPSKIKKAIRNRE